MTSLLRRSPRARATANTWLTNIEQGIQNRRSETGNQMKRPERFNPENRLIDFAVRIIRVAEALPKTPVGRHISGQIARSGTSPGPHYGEAQSAESRGDFVHKMKVCLKELRETRAWVLMIQRAELLKPVSILSPLLEENDELISIFVTSVKTARKAGEASS
jgi:four helix bundle protein